MTAQVSLVSRIPRPRGSAHPEPAYLFSRHPRASQASVDEQLRDLRAFGVTVHAFPVRPTSGSDLLGALLALLVTHPRTFRHSLRQALKSGPSTPKGYVQQLVQLSEAALLVLDMTDAGVRHVHVVGDSADTADGACIARLAVTIGTRADHRPWTWSLAMPDPTGPGLDVAATIRSARFVVCASAGQRARLAALVEAEQQAKLHLLPDGKEGPVLRTLLP